MAVIFSNSEFGQFFDAVHGNCYVFNSGWVGDEEGMIAKRPGRGSGKLCKWAIKIMYWGEYKSRVKTRKICKEV